VEDEGPERAVTTLLPWLSAAGMAGVARQTVWTQGEVAIALLGLEAPVSSVVHEGDVVFFAQVRWTSPGSHNSKVWFFVEKESIGTQLA
jgi:hypothetical protein